MKILKITVVAALVMVALSLASCTGKKFQVSGVISDAPDSLLLFENMSLNGPVVVDSVRLGADGSFSFEGEAPTAPEFYRLRIARQIINVAVDSTEHVTVKASYPTMTGSYEVEGSTECSKIRELALMQLNLQAQINAVVQNPNVSYEKEADSVRTILEVYKYKVKNDYIFKEPWRAYAYFALFQTITLGQQVGLIFDPQSKKEDVQAYAAVATSWDTYHPGSERGTNLHNIAIEGMKNVRILQAEQTRRSTPARSTVRVSSRWRCPIETARPASSQALKARWCCSISTSSPLREAPNASCTCATFTTSITPRDSRSTRSASTPTSISGRRAWPHCLGFACATPTAPAPFT